MAAKKAKAKGPEQSGSESEPELEAIMKEFYAQQIELLREKIEAGDGEALLDAMLDVCMSGAPMPTWLSFHVAAAIRRYSNFQVATLDEAFRVPKRARFEARSKRVRYGLMIYFEIGMLHSVGVPITQELYHAIGELHGVGRNVVSECYSRELRRRGGRFVSKVANPSGLPARLRPIYESITGKKVENRL